MIVLSMILLALIIYKKNKDFITSLIYAILSNSLLLYVITELLSINNNLNNEIVTTLWIIINLLYLIILLLINRHLQIKDITNKIKDFLKEKYILKIVFSGLFLLIILIAIKTVPYNYDSMTYHLPRIMHWVQNGSVAHYTTNIIRQITSSPFAEFINLHIYLIYGNDVFFNLPQCLCFIINALLVYNICKKINISEKWCYIAMLLFIATPIAFCEAFSTQNDNVSAMFVLLFVYLILDFMNKEIKLQMDKNSIVKLIMVGITLGLGYLTKPSIAFIIVVFLIYLLAVCIRRKDKIKNVAFSTMLVAIVAFIIITPELSRNIKTFNRYSDPSAGKRQIVGTLKPNYLFINFLKNVTFNFPTKYIGNSEDIIYKGVIKVANLANVNIDDESISENGSKYQLNSPNYGHDTAINPIVVWTLLGAIILGIWFRLKQKEKTFNYMFWLSTLSFMFLMIALRWEIYETRYEIAYLALLIIASVTIFDKIKDNYKQVTTMIEGTLVFLSITGIISMTFYNMNITIHQQERPNGYNEVFYIRNIYDPMCNEIIKNNYSSIGLKFGECDNEYYLWVLLKDYDIKIEHIDVNNNSNMYSNKEFIPDAIIYYGKIEDINEEYKNKYEVKTQYRKDIFLLEKK